MSTILWAGTLLGAVLGLLHAVYLYRQRVIEAQRMATDGMGTARAEGLYCALWALLLWILFGSYVLVLWVIAVLAYSIVKAVPRRRPA